MAEIVRLRVELLTMRAHLGAFKCRLDQAGVACPAVSEEFDADMARGPR